MRSVSVFALAVTIAMAIGLWLVNLSKSPAGPGASDLSAQYGNQKEEEYAQESPSAEVELRAKIRAEMEAEERVKIRARIEEEERREREIAATEAMAAAMAAQARVQEAEQQAQEQRDLERRQLKQQLTKRLEELRENQSFAGSANRSREEQEIMRQLTILEATR